MIKSRFVILICVLFAMIGAFTVEAAGVVEGPTCIVIPTRNTIVQFSFDILRLRREIYLVAQDKEIGGDATVLHIWDDSTQDWVRIGVEEYVAGTIFSKVPKRLIVVGGEKDVPQELAAAPAWAGGEAYQIESLDLVTIINKLQTIFHFNEREWKWIAQRYNITFEDLNADRRRYGRYGKPGEKRQAMPGEVKTESLETIPEGTIEIISAPEPELDQQPAKVVDEVKAAADIAPEDK